MGQTQLGSMFLGSPSSVEELRRSTPTPGVIIHIIDKHTNRILDDIHEDYIIENEHYRSLVDSQETFNFTTMADKRFSPHLEKRNRVVIPDDDRGYMEFIISESVKIHEDGNLVETEVYSDASYLELKKSRVIEPQTLSEYNVTMHANFALNGTAWRVGEVESDYYRTITIENHTNPYNYLKTIANEFDLELNFRVEVRNNKIIGRYVDLVQQIGKWRGTEVEFGVNLGSIKRREDTDNLVTALVGLGPRPAEEGEERLEVFVEDLEAYQRWGFVDRDGNRQHLIEYYEPQSDRQEMTLDELRQYTRTELDKRVNEAIQYESEILDLEHVPGLRNYKLRFGDTIRIKDTKFNPPLYLEARIHTQRRNIKMRGRKQVTLGDYTEYTEEEVTAIWQQLRQEIEAKIGVYELLEYAEPKRYESITAPENTDRIWVDTSEPQRVIKVYEDEEWRAVGDVTSENTANDTARVGGAEAAIVRDNAAEGKTAKDTIDENRVNWDRASAFNEDGTLNVEKLYGRIPDDAIVSAADWNRQGTYIDETGVYTGTIITDQLVAGDVLIDDALIKNISASKITAGLIDVDEITIGNESVLIDESGVSVRDGSFFLEDDNFASYSIVERDNLIPDPLFIMAEVDADTHNASRHYADLTTSEHALYQNSYWWAAEWSTDQPKVFTPEGDGGVAGLTTYFPPVGNGAVATNRDVSAVRTYLRGRLVELGLGETFTVSAYVKKQAELSEGRPRIRVFIYVDGQEMEMLTSVVFDQVSNDHSSRRVSTQFTIPDNPEIVNMAYAAEVVVELGSGEDQSVGNWVQWSGVQVVKGEHPTNLKQDTQLWSAIGRTWHDMPGSMIVSRGFEGNYIQTYTNTNLYIRAHNQTRSTEYGSNSFYIPHRASSFPTSSSITTKTNFEELSDYDTMRIFNNADPILYRTKGDLKRRIYDKPKVGFISEAVPQELRDEDGVDPYSITSVLWNVVKIKSDEILNLERRIESLEELLEYVLQEER